MNTKDLIRLGVPVGEPIALAHVFIQSFIAQGKDGAQLEPRLLPRWRRGSLPPCLACFGAPAPHTAGANPSDTPGAMLAALRVDGAGAPEGGAHEGKEPSRERERTRAHQRESVSGQPHETNDDYLLNYFQIVLPSM